MKNRNYILGIDTSNYKTSVAIIDQNKKIICDHRRVLKVKQGERGLRQSDALFQHIRNLPELLDTALGAFDGTLSAIAYSSRPRPVENSYMPVFLAGESCGRSIASVLKIPSFGFSHQEGHIEAVKAYSDLQGNVPFLACHFSGGTCELLKVETEDMEQHGLLRDRSFYQIEIVGGTRDISFGQVLDRAGVAMGLAFPAGEEMDRLALAQTTASKLLTAVKVRDGWLNLSGIDTQIKTILQKGEVDRGALIKEIFDKLSDAISLMLLQGSNMTGIDRILMAGGVSSSRYIESRITDRLEKQGIHPTFGSGALSQDNAVGTALLGGKYLWD